MSCRLSSISFVIAPGSKKLEVPDGGGNARITFKNTPGKLVITHEFDSEPAIINPKDYSALLKVESALGKKSSKIFLLEKESVAAKGETAQAK